MHGNLQRMAEEARTKLLETERAIPSVVSSLGRLFWLKRARTYARYLLFPGSLRALASSTLPDPESLLSERLS